MLKFGAYLWPEGVFLFCFNEKSMMKKIPAPILEMQTKIFQQKHVVYSSLEMRYGSNGSPPMDPPQSAVPRQMHASRPEFQEAGSCSCWIRWMRDSTKNQPFPEELGTNKKR